LHQSNHFDRYLFFHLGADVLIYDRYDEMGPAYDIDGTILFTKPKTH